MSTPAARRYMAQTAAAQGSENPVVAQAASNLYEQMLMLVIEHRRVLKTLQSLERKLQAKSKLLPEYEAYVAGVLASNSGQQDEVLVTVMLWHIDTGNIEAALPLAEYALRHKLVMPDRFERVLACTIAEEVAETAHRLFDTEQAISAEHLSRTVALTRDYDMFDEARAKLYKQLGLAQEKAGWLPDAMASYQTALQLHEKCGVKKFIERIERELKKDSQQQTPAPEQSTQTTLSSAEQSATQTDKQTPESSNQTTGDQPPADAS